MNGNIGFIDRFLSRYLIHQDSKTSTSSSEFAQEWAEIFCVFLNSTEKGEKYLKILNQLNIKVSTSLKFENGTKICNVELDKIFNYFLLNQIIFLYEAQDLIRVKKIINYIKANNPTFYREHNLKRELIRSRVLSKGMLNFFREFRRILSR